MSNTEALRQRLADEADLCRNEGCNDIAALLDEARAALAQPAASASRAAMVRLSRALGNPREVEADPGESIEDALIRMAAERIEQQPAASGEPVAWFCEWFNVAGERGPL